MLFASKAFPCTAVYRLLAEEGLACDVASGGELFLALRGGFDPARIYFHGNAKSVAELRDALEAGVGHIVIDSLHELDRLERVAAELGRRQEVLIRITPGVAGDTHHAISTGQTDSKFGFAPVDARRRSSGWPARRTWSSSGCTSTSARSSSSLDPFRAAVQALAALGDFPVYNVGGGLGVAYMRPTSPPAVADYVEAIVVDRACRTGRGQAAARSSPAERWWPTRRSRCTPCETVKRNVSTWVAVDGGMSDNLRPMLYGSKYEALVADRPLAAADERCRLAGKHCESGDVILRDAWLPTRARAT